MDRDFPLSTAKIQEGFKKALTDTTTRLGKLKNEPGLDTEIARLKMILSLVSETNIPGTPEFAPNVNNQLLRKQELQREIKTLTTRTKKQQAVVDVLGVLCDDWKEDAQRIITEIRRLLLGDYAG
jgi:lipid A disaccharide synthetase